MELSLVDKLKQVDLLLTQANQLLTEDEWNSMADEVLRAMSSVAHKIWELEQ